MTTLHEAAQQALEALELAKLNGKAGLYPAEAEEIADAITSLRAALAEPQSTHSEECWRWHHACAVAKIERAHGIEGDT